MEQKGYWVVCEAMFYKGKKQDHPSSYFMQVPGFFNADTLGESYEETFESLKKKLIKNIQFLEKCYCDVPDYHDSQKLPDMKYFDNLSFYFLTMEELGLMDEKFSMAA